MDVSSSQEVRASPAAPITPNTDGTWPRANKGRRQTSSALRREQNRLSSQRYRQRRKTRLAVLDQLLESDLSPGAASHHNVLQGAHLNQCSLPLATEPVDAAAAAAAAAVDADGARATAHSAASSFQDTGPERGDPLSTILFTGQEAGIWNSHLYGPAFPSHDMTISALNGAAMATNHQTLPISATLADELFLPDPRSSLWCELLGTRPPYSVSGPCYPEHSNQMRPYEPPFLAAADVSDGQGLLQHDPMCKVLDGLQGLSISQKRQVLGLLKLEVDAEQGSEEEKETSCRRRPTLETRSGKASSPGFFSMFLGVKQEAREYEMWLGARITARGAAAPQLPDPKMNSLRIIHSSFYAAILANSNAIGLNNYEVLKEDSLSPYSIIRSPSDAAAAAAYFASIVPPGLAPCDAQLRHPHHPYLDVIPFREFRARAVAALQCDPPLFDEEQMCCDLDAEGLVCWGARAEGEGVSAESWRGMDAEVPWDARSWEPKAWFLDKYWFLVGGPDGEMHTNARVWNSRKGAR